MPGSSAASYLKFPRTWLEVNGSTTVQLYFAVVTQAAELLPYIDKVIETSVHCSTGTFQLHWSKLQADNYQSGTSFAYLEHLQMESLNEDGSLFRAELGRFCLLFPSAKNTFFLISSSYLFICGAHNCVHYCCYRIPYQ